MPHKITLTGKPVSSLLQKGTYHTFDMEENGSPGAPKGLPKSSTITYTVFINQKQLKKAGLTEVIIYKHKKSWCKVNRLWTYLLRIVQEKLVSSVSKYRIPEKQKEKDSDKVSLQPVVKEEVKSEEKPKGPEGTEDFVLLEQISVPEEFLNSHPNPEKTQQVIEYVKQQGI